MASVLDIVGGLFKGQILDAPKDIEGAYRRRRVVSVSKTIHRNFHACLWSNGLRSEPSCLMKALDNLILTADKEHVDWVSICPGLRVGYFWIGREIIGIRVKADNENECCEKH
jgi:hypothetical protein